MENNSKPSSKYFKKFNSIPYLFKILILLVISSLISAPFIRNNIFYENSNFNFQLGINSKMIYKSQDILYYIPSCFNPSTTKILFVVHGASRTYENYFKYWMNYNISESENVILIAPHFDFKVFSHYQILNIWGIRADLRLIELFNAFNYWLNLTSTRFYIFGFSGGGQFVHRFVLTHPEYIERAVAGAPGWYTFPNHTLYPYGIDTSFYHPRSLEFKLEEALNANLGLIVGENDTLRTSNLLTTPQADMQGYNRLERSKNWFNSMKNLAEANSWPFNFEYKIVPNAGHSNSKMIPDSINFLFKGGF
ncbi:MAG: hypothetical protein ACTSRZ_10205 [Promethearchaeota archaeon]